MRNTLDLPIHYTVNTGYLEPCYDTPCRLGDSNERSFRRGTDDWDIVTCKNCLKHKPTDPTQNNKI